ncbi:MAG: cytochrome c oxidase subunit II [Candidatus Bipolaricaulota bacterium]|nr:cytochrome c oxidase subunit II [Candidatus Bipolaricaulota bacterium]MDW8329078.1 cytochrome c oxidase subunit II [Candidatus Bipolaricaulota bacterium]
MQGILLAIVLVLLIVGAVALTLSGTLWLSPLASNWGMIDNMLVITLVVTGLAFVVLNLVLAYLVWRYRARDGQKATYFAEDHKLERNLILITALGIIVMLGPGLFVYSEYIHPPREAMTVEVLGQQWRWSFRYPGADGQLGRTDPKLFAQNAFGIDVTDPAAQDDVLVTGPLHLPLNKPVVIQLRSKDVLHSFYVPEFRAKMDAVPGMVTRLWFTPTKMGTFDLLCVELCGTAHFQMRSKVIVESPKDFERWLQQQPTVAQTIKR